jgi:hypothetical protein
MLAKKRSSITGGPGELGYPGLGFTHGVTINTEPSIQIQPWGYREEGV